MISSAGLSISFPHIYDMMIDFFPSITINYLYWSGCECQRLAASLKLSAEENVHGALAVGALAVAYVAPEIELAAAGAALEGESIAIGIQVINEILKLVRVQRRRVE